MFHAIVKRLGHEMINHVTEISSLERLAESYVSDTEIVIETYPESCRIFLQNI